MGFQNIYKSNEEITEKGQFKTTILAGNGTFEIQSSWIGDSLRKVNDYQFFGLPAVEEKITVTANNLPKIPADAIKYVIKWYRDTTLATGKEAQINFYNAKGMRTLNVDGVEKNLKDIEGVHFWSDELFSYTPKQRNSSALTSVDNDSVYEALNKYIGMYVETHSHNSMQAFASGTDLSNSKVDALQLVFGHLNTNRVQMHSWITVRGLTSEYVSEDIVKRFVELPEHVLADDKKYYYDIDKVSDITFDEDLIATWEKQVFKTPVYTAPTWGNTRTQTYTGHGAVRPYGQKHYKSPYETGRSIFDTYEDSYYGDYSDYALPKSWDRNWPEDVEEDVTEVETVKTMLGRKPFENTHLNAKYSVLAQFLDDYFTFDGTVSPGRLLRKIKALLYKIGR